MSEEKIFLTIKQAIALLPKGDSIHVFCNPRMDVLVGADWSRAEVLKEIKEAKVREVTGPEAQKMNHGLFVSGKRGYWFIETKKD